MIRVQHLTKQFADFTAVNDLSFDVQAGEVLGFLGPNGAGKSTTMKMISGFLQASAGKVEVCGFDVATQPLEVQQIMGYLPEGAPAYPEMRVIDFLNFIAKVRGLKGVDKSQRIEQVIKQVQLEDVLHKTIETLSKGFVRRVGLAQAIMHDPKVLILDEPTDGLDPNQKHQVRELIKGLAHDKIVIISTHILEEVSAVCSRALIINQGRLLLDGKPDELERQSRHHNAMSVQLAQPQPQALQVLSGIAGISEIEQLNDHSFMLFTEQGKMLLPQVVRCLDEHQWEVETIHLEKGRLDDVFRQVTQATQAN